MTSKQRMALAMSHQIPDRVPVMCQLALGHYFLHCGLKPSEIWFDSSAFANALIDRQRAYRFDGILVNLPGRPQEWQSQIVSSQHEAATEKIVWRCGLVTTVPPDDNAHTYLPDGSALGRADIANIDASDPALYRTPGYVWNIWHSPELWDISPDADLTDPSAYPAWFTQTLRLVRSKAPDVSVHAEVFSPFTHLMELLGYEPALFALIEYPEVCQKLLSSFVQIVNAQIHLYAACHPDAILVSSAFAGAGFISRSMYEQFVLPYEQQVCAAIKKHNVFSYVHTCGAIGDRLDLMSQVGYEGVDTLDPPPLGTVDLARAKAQFGRRFFFKGNLDAVSEMLYAEDAVFDNAVKNRLATGKPGGGYILSSACSVSPHVTPKRLSRLVELADQYGAYNTDRG